MTGPEIQATYFSPILFFFYLFLILTLMVVYYEWIWARKCDRFVKVLVVKSDGSTDTKYAPKSGGYVSLKNPNSDTTRLWPVNKFSAIEMMYPGDGFIPNFLQKKIKAVIVDEEDWEPLLNRGSYTEGVASPDVVKALRDIAEVESQDPKTSDALIELADRLSTAPTRDMVASPAVLGNLMTEKVSEMAVTVSKDTFDKLEGIARRLERLPNATIVYAGLGAIILMLAVVAVQGYPLVQNLKDSGWTAIGQNVQAIMQALGVAVPPTVVP